MPSFPSFPPPVPSPPDSVNTDIRCRKCGYNLRGLKIDGLCPECGSPVGAAILGDMLKFSLPRWLRGLARGAVFVYYGCTSIVVGFFVIIAGIFIPVILSGAASAASALFSIAMIATFLGIFGGGIFAIVGWWFLTNPDPSGIGEDQYGTARKIIRITLIIWIADLLLSLFSSSPAVGPQTHQVIEFLSLGASITFAVGLGAQLRYLEKLSNRLPDPKLSGKARGLKTVFPVCYVLMTGLQDLSIFVPAAMPPRAPFQTIQMFIGCTGAVGALGALGCFLTYLRLIRGLMRRFREEATLSEHIWASRPLNAA